MAAARRVGRQMIWAAMKRFEEHALVFRPAAARGVAKFCALIALSAAPAHGETLRAHYSLSLIGLSIGSASASGVIEARNYRVDISTKTTGLANLINNTKVAATASGVLAAAGPAPASYANSTSNSNESRIVRMSLNANVVRVLEVNPEPWDASVRVPVSESARRHIVDPVSALIMAVPPGEPLTGPSACNRTIPVFDGVTRFDVRLSYMGARNVQTKGYAGPVTICSARYTPIAGHRTDSSATKYMAENHEMDVWLAPMPDAHVVVPYHIDIRTSAGMLVIDAAEFQIGQRQASSGAR
jgi:hypothetical protein